MARIPLNPPPHDHFPPKTGDSPELGDSYKTLIDNLNTMLVDIYSLAGLYATVESFTGNRTLASTDNGKILRCEDASNVTITVPSTLSIGFNIGFAMWGAGTITMSAGSGMTNRGGKTALSTQYQVGSLLVLKVGEFVLGGDFA